jgi:hypothetical protein
MGIPYQNIVRTSPPLVFESFELDYSYVHGVGLHIVLDVPFINREVIEGAITKFKSLGEVKWISPDPVSPLSLPQLSKAEALSNFPSGDESLRVRDSY